MSHLRLPTIQSNRRTPTRAENPAVMQTAATAAQHNVIAGTTTA
jgi:hypothetical protein